MTENMKNFLQKVSEDRELAEKICKLDKAELIAAAKELGFELTEADFTQPNGELADNELDAVTGGALCACIAGGGGKASKGYKVCACVLGGGGETEHGNARCVCIGAGTGNDFAISS